MIDIGWLDACFNHKHIIDRNNLHDGFAGCDYNTDRLDCQLVHNAGLRRKNLDPFQLVLCGDALLSEFCKFVFNVAQFGKHLGTAFLVKLQYLKFGFGKS